MGYNVQWTEKYAGTALSLAGYNLSFLDNFDVNSISESNGTNSIWYSNVHSPFGYASFETKGDLTSPFEVANGFLDINMELDGGAWKSGMIQTVNSRGEGFKQSYGYFEMKAAFTGGENAWPAFWLISEATSTHPRVEIDILEAYGSDPKGHHTALHIRDTTDGVPQHEWASDYSGLASSLFDGKFHTYGVQITKQFIITYMDGKELARTNAGDFATGDFYMIVDLARTNDDPTEGDNVRNSMTIDYIRVYSDPTLTGQNVTGTNRADTLVGTKFGDTIDGKADNDQMSGGTGDDIYYCDSSNDLVFEKNGGGNDTIYASTSYSIKDKGTYVETVVLTAAAVRAEGNSLDNLLVGNDGANILIGGAGTDTLSGGLGDDTYYVESSKDLAKEKPNEGTDTVISSVSVDLSSQYVGQYIENATLSSGRNDNVYGNSLANTLVGNNAKNILDGRDGADVMNGGGGDDIYYCDSTKDVVNEGFNQGMDKIITDSFISNSIANVEIYQLSQKSTGYIYTGAGSQWLYGNAAANILDGGDGIDYMDGGAGNDRYYCNASSDIVVEIANGGIDTIYASASFSINGTDVENLRLTGAAISAEGNALDNNLLGSSGANIMVGGAGADTLNGGDGSDILTGDGGQSDRGADLFVFDWTPSSKNVDTISDFDSGLDHIALWHSVFRDVKNSNGTVNFVTAGEKYDSLQACIRYNNATGVLNYDSDGVGADQGTTFGIILNKAALAAESFFVL